MLICDKTGLDYSVVMCDTFVIECGDGGGSVAVVGPAERSRIIDMHELSHSVPCM